MIRLNSLLVLVLGIAFCLIISGCAQKDIQNQTSNVSSITQNDSETEDIGTILPEDEFDTGEQENRTEGYENKEDDSNISSSTESNSTNNNSSLQSSSDVSSTTSDKTSSVTENEKEDTSSDSTSEPTESVDEDVELPFDKW